MINTGGNMRKVMRPSSTKKRSSEAQKKPVTKELSSNQRRFLQVLITGVEGEEPDLLAGRP
jgi:hypothetical protein